MKLASNNNKKIFFTLDTKIDIQEKVDIILSPEFYWVRIFDIPVKYVSQAKGVVPNLFEEVLEEDIDKISYHIIKQEEHKFLCFAYDNKKIFKAIKNSGIELTNINRVYFAQTECYDLGTFKVNEKSFFYTNENILVKAPEYMSSILEDGSDKIQKINLSSNFIDIKFYNKVMSLKKVILIASILALLSAMNFYKAYDNSVLTTTIKNKIQEIKVQNKLPTSSIQANSIINEKQSLVEKEIEKRELFYLLLSKPSLKSFQMKKDEATFEFLGDNKDIIEILSSNKKEISSSDIENGNLNIRIKL